MLDSFKFKRAFTGQPPSGIAFLRPHSGRALLLWRAALGVAIFLVLFALVGFFLVPPVARYYLAKELTEQLGRQVTVERIKVNPFSMVAIVRGLSTKERDAS